MSEQGIIPEHHKSDLLKNLYHGGVSKILHSFLYVILILVIRIAIMLLMYHIYKKNKYIDQHYFLQYIQSDICLVVSHGFPSPILNLYPQLSQIAIVK